jgi:hypothetical protein
MDKKKDSMKGMSATQKAAVMRGGVRDLKDVQAKYTKRMRDFDADPFGNIDLLSDMPNSAGRRSRLNNAVKAGRQITDRSRTIGRLDSQDDRSARSATYRLAKMKADKKMSKESKMSKKANKFELSDGFIPTMNKATGNKKKGNK